jgi:hypothetical protein
MGDNHANGRGAGGLFARGNQVARGNAGNTQPKSYRRALMECATPQKVAEVEAVLFRLAVEGDITAVKCWLDHMCGRPPQALEVSGMEGRTLGMEAVTAAVMAALAEFPEARAAVANRLAAIEGAKHVPDDGAGGPT